MKLKRMDICIVKKVKWRVPLHKKPKKDMHSWKSNKIMRTKIKGGRPPLEGKWRLYLSLSITFALDNQYF